MKKYISAKMQIVAMNNIIATSNYGTNTGQDGDGSANMGESSFAPSRRGYSEDDF